MADGYLRQSAGLIVNAATILASHHENEYAAIALAFGTDGHNHSGVAGQGPQLGTTSVADGSITYAKMQTVSANKILGSVAGGVVSEITCTAAGRALLDDADNVAQLVTLGLTATAAELNILDGATLDVTELNYVDGVTSSIQSQLNGKQALHASLTSISGLTTSADQIIYTTASNTYATSSISSGGRAIINTTAVADKLPYYNGTGTATTADFTAGGRALVNSAGTANTFPYFSSSNTVTLTALTAGGRALINVTGVTDTLPYYTSSSAATTTSLTAGGRALVAATGTSGTMLYFSGTNTVSNATITAAGLAILDDTDNTAQRTTLGLGSIATQASSNVTITGGSITGITDLAVADGGTGASTFTSTALLKGNGTSAISASALLLDANNYLSGHSQSATTVQALTSSGGAVAWNMNSGAIATHTLTENTTFSAPSNIKTGATYALRITQHASSPKTVAWNSVFRFPGGTDFVASTTNSAIDVLTFISFDGTNLECVGQKAFA